MEKKFDVTIVGAGPSGLACAIEASKQGFDHVVLEKGCIVNSIYHFPVNMTFFTTADLLEIGDIPMIVSSDKPKRVDALRYYRRVSDYFQLNVRDYQKVLSVEGEDEDFSVRTEDRVGQPHLFRSRKIILAVGYYDNPNLLGIPGEDLPKVSHYFNEPHPYFHKRVAVIGGNNSAAEAALELYRNGVEVTLIHRGKGLGKSIKYWVRPDIQNRIDRDEIAALFSSRVTEIREREIIVSTAEGEVILPNDFVLAMTGYHPDAGFLKKMGIEVDLETYIPKHDPETLESNVPGIYLAGSLISGRLTNRIFIENGRFHGAQIFKHWPAPGPSPEVVGAG